VINVFREQVGMFQEDVALPLIRQLDQHAQVRTREQGHWSALLTDISWEWESMHTTNYCKGVLQNLTDRNFHWIVALPLLDVHIAFLVDNSAVFSPLFLKILSGTHTG
jgi:hypothetical protein